MIARETKEEFIRMREVDGVTLEDCAKQLGIGIATAKRWPGEAWYEEMASTIRRARDEAITQAATEAVREKKSQILDSQTEWDGKRRSYIQRMRNAMEDTVVGYERIAQDIKDPNNFESLAEYKSGVEAATKLADMLRKVLSVEYEEKLSIAAAQSAVNQRLSPEEIASLTTDQLRVLVLDGIQRLREGDPPIDAEEVPE